MLVGGSGKDRLSGSDGNDRLSGGRGNDRLTAGRGRNRLYGGFGDDTLYGVNGRVDRIDCGGGFDEAAPTAATACAAASGFASASRAHPDVELCAPSRANGIGYGDGAP